MTATLSRTVAKGIGAVSIRKVPANVVRVAKLLVLDTIGCILAAWAPGSAIAPKLSSFLSEDVAQMPSTVIGSGRRASATVAALANGTGASYCAVDPLHVPTGIHAPALVVPAALAVAEANKRGGREFLEATLAGIEIACRVGDALVSSAVYERGYYPTAIAGIFGAAAAAGRACGLDVPSVECALAQALQQASGLTPWTGNEGAETRSISVGLAARNGVTAAFLARAGFKGAPPAFDGMPTVFSLFSGCGHSERLVEDWGKRFYVEEFTQKIHASASYTHPGLDALLKLVRKERIRARDVTSIVVRVPTRIAPLIAGEEIRACSARYVLPVALIRGSVGIKDLIEDRMKDQEVARLHDVTAVRPDGGLKVLGAGAFPTIVEIRTDKGELYESRSESAKGTPENPLSEGEVVEKYLQSVRYMAGRLAEQLAEMVLSMDRMQDIRTVGKTLRQITGAGGGERLGIMGG